MTSRHPTHLGEAQSAAMPPGDDGQDNLGVQAAIQESLRARNVDQAIQLESENTEEVNLTVHTCQNRVSIEDRIKDLTMQAPSESPLIYDSQGDTWIYIDAPQRQPEQDEYEYKLYAKRYEAPMLMQKVTLTKYSPVLAKLFGPTEQYRFLRRRKLVNKLPSHIKYVIDLTPPSEGEEAVFLTTELCCSEGVRLWHQSNQIWSVSTTLVKGEEDHASASARSLGSFNGIDTVAGGSDRTNSEAPPSTAMALEYSPVRHRASIERVLYALQGMNTTLDSATKVWTTFAVAKNFEITHSPLEDLIIRWMRAYPNSYFLEVLPEVSHQIADGLQNYDLARDSFAILVGEEALDSLRHDREPWVHKRTTFGRKKEELPEQMHTRIEYASKSFLERINRDFADLVSMQWIDELPEVRRLLTYTPPEILETALKLNDLLKEFVSGSIYKMLCSDYDTVPGPDLHHDGGHDLLPRLDRAAVWASMPQGERILSRTYWEALNSSFLFKGMSNLDIPLSWDLNFRGGQLSDIEKRELDRGTYREIRNFELKAVIQDGQTRLDNEFDQANNMNSRLNNAQQKPNANAVAEPLQVLPDRTITRTQSQNKLRKLFPALPTELNFYNAQRESNVESLPTKSNALAVDVNNSAKDLPAGNRSAPLSEAAQSMYVLKPLKRTQDFSDAASAADKQSDFKVHRKRPFGAARDEPTAQVQKNFDPVNFSLLPSGQQPAADNAFKQSAGHGVVHAGSSARTDPWRGYSDQLGRADESLQRLASKADRKPKNSNHEREKPHWETFDQFPTPQTPFRSFKATPKSEAAPAASKAWASSKGLNEDDRVRQQFEYLKPRSMNVASPVPKRALYEGLSGDDEVRQQFEDLRPKPMHSVSESFDLDTFFAQAAQYIKAFAIKKLRSTPHLEIGIVNTLVCLEDTEWKYLPLYAGGNDDGSMGVFNDDLPTAEHGFTTAGPEVHDGLTPANSIETPSEFEFIGAGDSASTFNASTATNRGFSDTIRRGRVHAADSADDSTSDSFTMMTPSADSEDEETFARMQVEAQEMSEEFEEAKGRPAGKGKEKMVEEDENYADLFEYEEEDDSDDTDRAEANDWDDDNEDEGDDMVMV